MTTADFIEKYRHEDVRKLALMGGRFPDVDMPYALNQIAGWQTACEKLPTWASREGIVFPPHISMEQCSSESTAKYKVQIVQRLRSATTKDSRYHDVFVDLTGGFGVDFSYMAQHFSKAIYVEQQQHLCDIAKQNFLILGLHHAEVVCCNGVEYIKGIEPVVFAYLDPARRDAHGVRTYALEDCTPNILEIKDLLLEKARTVMVKLSPMVDWHKVVNDLCCVSELHIVSVRNECKELLVVLQKNYTDEMRIFCVNDDEIVDFSERKANAAHNVLARPDDDVVPGNWLYEANASLMKAGCFALLCERYGIKKIGIHSNLYVSNNNIDFPGRKFEISAVSSMNKKELKQVLETIDRANIAVRNFPLSAEELRKRLKLKDGGETYIFGTTNANDNHILLLCKRA